MDYECRYCGQVKAKKDFYPGQRSEDWKRPLRCWLCYFYYATALWTPGTERLFLKKHPHKAQVDVDQWHLIAREIARRKELKRLANYAAKVAKAKNATKARLAKRQNPSET